ncbi:MAG: hypothetical protein Q7R96_04880 [Nanoarchaeota archaeon]|nr:hypothetical protein [Nanoarchaeota archaeon]
MANPRVYERKSLEEIYTDIFVEKNKPVLVEVEGIAYGTNASGYIVRFILRDDFLLKARGFKGALLHQQHQVYAEFLHDKYALLVVPFLQCSQETGLPLLVRGECVRLGLGDDNPAQDMVWLRAHQLLFDGMTINQQHANLFPEKK